MSYQRGITVVCFPESFSAGCVSNPGAMIPTVTVGQRAESKTAQDSVHTARRSVRHQGRWGEHTPTQENPLWDLYTVWRLSNAGWHLTYMNTVPYITAVLK